jgi:polyphosphate glucokinase
MGSDDQGGRIMKVLVVDVGGTHIKILATGKKEQREFASGPSLTAQRLVSRVRKLAEDWKYQAVSIGFPGPVLHNRPVAEPRNLGGGWMGFDFEEAFKRPTKIVNDAAMQALGSYRSGKMLFLGLGTGLGSTLIADGILEPMELGHLPYKKGTYEDYVGVRGLRQFGKTKWRQHVADVVARLIAALEPTDVVIGGGNVSKLKEMPPGCRAGDNSNAFTADFACGRAKTGGPSRMVASMTWKLQKSSLSLFLPIAPRPALANDIVVVPWLGDENQCGRDSQSSSRHDFWSGGRISTARVSCRT